MVDVTVGVVVGGVIVEEGVEEEEVEEDEKVVEDRIEEGEKEGEVDWRACGSMAWFQASGLSKKSLCKNSTLSST